MLISIPVISPVQIQLGAAHAQRLLPSLHEQAVDADYTIHDDTSATRDSANYTLDEIEQVAYIKEYHDPEWWRERLRIIKERLSQEP